MCSKKKKSYTSHNSQLSKIILIFFVPSFVSDEKKTILFFLNSVFCVLFFFHNPKLISLLTADSLENTANDVTLHLQDNQFHQPTQTNSKTLLSFILSVFFQIFFYSLYNFIWDILINRKNPTTIWRLFVYFYRVFFSSKSHAHTHWKNCLWTWFFFSAGNKKENLTQKNKYMKRALSLAYYILRMFFFQ